MQLRVVVFCGHYDIFNINHAILALNVLELMH